MQSELNIVDLRVGRQTILGILFAVFLSAPSVLALCFGLVGSSGNSLFTGVFLATSTVSVGLLCQRRTITLMLPDFVFLSLIFAILSSFVLNGQTSNLKEWALLALSLGAYPACRMMAGSDLLRSRQSFIAASGLVVLLGTIATGFALFQQWGDEHGKPYVFGFDAAPTYFLQTLALLTFALITAGNIARRRAAIIFAIFLPYAIFAASLVRFSFISLAGSFFLAIFFSSKEQRKHILVIGTAIAVSTSIGLIARYSKVEIFAVYALERSSGELTWERPPSCEMRINPKNSIAIRKALTLDAAFLIPRAGWFGTGLDSFMTLSCVERTEVHNSFLQITTEFGWSAGFLLLFLVLSTLALLLPMARQDKASLFVLCSLAFVIGVSLVHGRISRDSSLFALLGCAVGVYETSRTRAARRLRIGDVPTDPSTSVTGSS